MTRGRRKRPFSTRQAGVCLHFTSLPSRHGIGNIGASACRMVDEIKEMGLTVWQFLPANPTGYGDSPYQPLSVFAGNELLIDPDDLVTEGLLEPGEVASLEALPKNFVDYARVLPAKKALLRTAANRFARRGSAGLKADFERFLDDTRRLWLDDYALFRVIKAMHREQPWWQWPPPLARRDPTALATVRAEQPDKIDWFRVQQFFFDRQWRALKAHAGEQGVGLFGDMPIYVALDSSDAWSHRDLLLIDDSGRPSRVAGAPPDQFNPDGQLWGNPLYDWPRHEALGFLWWRDRLRHAAGHFDLARIDHFRGFESYWSVPFAEITARKGEWRPGPGDRFFEAVQNHLGSLAIVAEDLGDITPEVEALRRRHGIPGMRVLQFEMDEPDFDPAMIESASVCYTGTHDCDTTYGWFHGSRKAPHSWAAGKAARQNALRISEGKPHTIHFDMIRLAFSTQAAIAIAPMQDYLGLDSSARLNTPGTASGNWAWRLGPLQLTKKVKNRVRSLVEDAGRA